MEIGGDCMTDSPQPDRFRFLYVDLNSFFASVEQQLHPEYRNRPLAVVPTLADTTCCIAASYEAKALGIKTGTQVGEAKRICPQIILVMGEHGVYAEYSHKIAAAVDRCCPVAHTPSIDEMVCELMGREQEPPRARQIALAIKQAIKDDVGETLRCSIGLAPNRFLAKIASDMQKPDGLIGLLPSQLPRAIAHLELRDIPGVGARTETRLNAKGIHTMQQLLALDRKGMHALWNSVWGDRLYHWLRGAETGDDGAPVDSGVQKSLGHSHVLGPEHRTPEGAWAVAHKLLHKAAMRLRMERFKRHFSGLRHSGWSMEARFPPCQDTLTLLQALRGMWDRRPEGAEFARPFHVAITMHNLIAESDLEPSLFADPDRRADLAATMDRLNMKYGNTTLHFAAMLSAKDSAPTRISFTQIPVKYGMDYI
jgi:DNA polymerase-4